MTLTAQGTYRQKFRIFGITFSSKTGAFDVSVPLEADRTVQVALPFGATLKAQLSGTTVSASVSYGPFPFQIGTLSLGGTRPFDLTLDKANEIKGVLTLSS